MISGLTADAVLEPPAGSDKSAMRNVHVRKAGMHDIQPVLDLINWYAAKGIMLPRTEFELSENIRDFSVAYAGDRLVGCAALHFYSPVMGEVRSLAVAPEERAHGVGMLLIEALVREAEAYSLDALFAFTYVPGFFAKMGFGEVERGELPLKAWKDCLRCPKFNSCDEIAVLRVLAPQRYYTHHHAYSDATGLEFPEHVLVQLPTIKQTEGLSIPKKQ
jgi:amino-acid N-acetyltransferase